MRPYVAGLVLIPVVLALLASCSSHGKLQTTNVMPPSDRIVAIGCIGSTDDATRQIVKGLLENEDMWVGFSGSVVDYVLVDKKSAQIAQDLLRTNSELTGKWIQYYDLKDGHKSGP
jgi:hypothetical protein